MFCEQFKSPDPVVMDSPTSEPLTSTMLRTQIQKMMEQYKALELRESEDRALAASGARLDVIAKEQGFNSNSELLDSRARDAGFPDHETMRSYSAMLGAKQDAARYGYLTKWEAENPDLVRSSGRGRQETI